MRIVIILILLLSHATLAEPLFHFNVGAKWIYQLDGNASKTATNIVSEVQTVNGKNWYKLIEYGESFWVRNSENGQIEAVNFFEKDPDQFDTAEEMLIFKYPARVGETWNNQDSPTTYKGLKTISVPAGTFDCHEYYIDMGAGSYSLSCIAIHIGVVYNETVFEKNVIEVSRLVSYEL